MDPETLQFYNAHASETAGSYAAAASGVAGLFPAAFPPASRVLDLGCGSGKDLNALLELGYDARGLDASPEMIGEAIRLFPALEGKVIHDQLPRLATVPDHSFEGVLCSAVLMHLPEELLFDTVFNIRRILTPGGRLLLSIPLTGPATDPSTRRDEKGRLFNDVTPENFQFLFEKIGFRQLNRWDTADHLSRPDRRWATQLFVLENHGSRNLDKIEGILNRDKKDATYKPALFRALSELATTSYHQARWLPNGKVSLPLDLIADKWLEYYWPLIESELFIPQKRGEKPVCSKPVAFRSQLNSLIQLFRPMGGLSGFTVAYRSDALPREIRALHLELKATLRNTIRGGPLYYSGGGGSQTFTYDKNSRSIIMEADLWRELSIMGSWIADATLLRWAELTAEISQGALKPSQVIDHLLRVPIPERDVHAARTLYEQLPEKVCVWTDRNLDRQFDVDHAIPFVLWKNNDLWNLLPALPAMNNQKRDRLPTLDLVHRRKDCIVHYWTLMREQNPHRFDFEAGKLAGAGFTPGANWENRLFGIVSESIEVTAIQRGVDRWEPENMIWLPAALTPGDAQPEGDELADPTDPVANLILFDPPLPERYVTCVPFYDVAAAAGEFSPDQPIQDPASHDSWIRTPDIKITKDLFAIRVIGHSMEPKIPDGSICLFRGGEALAGTREGRIVLVTLRDSVDPETGGRLTIKRYSSQKHFDTDGQYRHTQITLQPLNPAYQPITLNSTDEDALKVLGEFVGVMK